MNVETQNTYNISMYGRTPKNNGVFRRFRQKILDRIKNRDIVDENKYEAWEKRKNIISNPATNRLIMGATALCTQPVIDYYNHRVDNETRVVSRNRTIAKIIAGTLVGICVRGSAYKITQIMTNPKSLKKWGKKLLPENIDLTRKKKLDNYRNAFSTILALVVMIFTNFYIDAPLTTYFTNKFNAKHYAEKGGNNG